MDKAISPFCKKCTRGEHGYYAHNFHNTSEHERWLLGANPKDSNVNPKVKEKK